MAWFLPLCSTIYTDSLGAETCLAGTQQRVACAHWVRLAQVLIAEKGHKVVHVAAHVGIQWNEAADAKAKEAAKLPPQVRVEPERKGDLTYQRVSCVSTPTKPGPSRMYQRTPQDIHPVSKRFIPWFRFVHGVVASPDYAHPATYWDNRASKVKCTHCGTWHNQSVHGYVACCSPDHPLQVAYFSLWGPARAHVTAWHQLAVKINVLLMGKLVVLTKLYALVVLRSRTKDEERASKHAASTQHIVDICSSNRFNSLCNI